MNPLELARQKAVTAIKSGKRNKGVLKRVAYFNKLADRENVKLNPYTKYETLSK